MMKRYVCGVVFDQDLLNVAMIRKTHPAWQRGRFNLPGGVVESDDVTLEYATTREIRQETGLDIHPDRWVQGVKQVGVDYEVHYLYTVLPGELSVRTTTEELAQIFQVRSLTMKPERFVPPAPAVILMCRERWLNCYAPWQTFTLALAP